MLYRGSKTCSSYLVALVPVLLANVQQDFLVGLDDSLWHRQSLGNQVTCEVLVDAQGIQRSLFLDLLSLGCQWRLHSSSTGPSAQLICRRAQTMLLACSCRHSQIHAEPRMHHGKI